jgi:hypothetical protein
MDVIDLSFRIILVGLWLALTVLVTATIVLLVTA